MHTRVARCAHHLARSLFRNLLRLENNCGADSGNGADSVKNRKWMDIMLNKLLAAAAMAAIAYAVVPANAAQMSAGCSGEKLTKTESSVAAMADGECKIAAQNEVALSDD